MVTFEHQLPQGIIIVTHPSCAPKMYNLSKLNGLEWKPIFDAFLYYTILRFEVYSV